MGPKKKPEEEDDPEYSPLLEALVKSQQLMQEQLATQQRREEQLQRQVEDQRQAQERREEQLQQQMQAQQEALTQALEKLTAGGGGGGEGPAEPRGPGQSGKAKKIDQPTLGPPKTIKLATFRHWHKKFQGYVKVQRLQEECDRGARRDILRSFLDDAWGPLWDTGRLGILDTDDMEEICTHLSSYLRGQRNPLLDRRDFAERRQWPSELVDE